MAVLHMLAKCTSACARMNVSVHMHACMHVIKHVGACAEMIVRQCTGLHVCAPAQVDHAAWQASCSQCVHIARVPDL